MLIGVFDSGIGGLTVLRALRAAWPGHSTLYLGDTARVPYGTKSPATVARYARQNALFLIEQGIELLVIACNTASAFAVEELTQSLPIPVVGVIEPGATAAAEVLNMRSGSAAPVVGVIGTGATISSGAYERALRATAPQAKIVTRACPLFVPLVEDGWEASPVVQQVARIYLSDWLPCADPCNCAPGQQLDVLVLGCTHYPVLKPVFAELFGPGVALIDSAEATARALAPHLGAATPESRPTHRMQVTDGAPGFAVIAQRLLGGPVGELEVVDIGTLVN